MKERNEITKMLNDALLTEYQQRDVYETYSYYLFGYSSPSIQQHLKDHMGEEMKHIETLQRYLAFYRAKPLVERLSIPQITPTSFRGILEFDLQLEIEAVDRYSELIEILEDAGRDYSSLRVEIENILIQEQEHVHDLDQWLRNPNLE